MKLIDIVENHPELLDTVEDSGAERDVKTVERPNSEVVLRAVADSAKTTVRTQCDPTPDLIVLQRGPSIKIPENCVGGYLIWCEDTEETWFAPDKECLDTNFIYRDDLEIIEIVDEDEAYSWAFFHNESLLPGVITRKKCYILDNPGNETYEVYYDSNYPARQYGKCTPQGTTVHGYKNRFYRDMAILELDEAYVKTSVKAARKFIEQQLKRSDAIIISDGAAVKETIGHSFFYIDDNCVSKVAEATFPSEKEQQVLIAEINGAYRALQMCRIRGKKNITYYYDNTSILNVFKNKKTEYIPEIKRYKELCRKMIDDGFDVNFVEIHPKTGENRDSDNKALMFFHNSCDGECRDIIDIFTRDYNSRAMTGNRTGVALGDAMKPKKPQGGSGNRQNNRGSYSSK